jgi:antitoxin component of MazEF toxin-antitoxin module
MAGLLISKAIPLELANQAKLIIKTNHLGLITPKFMTVDYERMATETAPNDLSSNSYYVADKKSVFGTPVFDVLDLKAVSYTDFNGEEQTAEDLTLDIALIEVTNDRHIITTPVTGRNGTVKEYMSDGDYQINIKGNLINPLANCHPEELLKALHDFCKAQVNIKVTSSLLYYLDIDTIVITKFSFKMVPGYRNVIDYELTCLSDLDPTIQQSDNVPA